MAHPARCVPSVCLVGVSRLNSTLIELSPNNTPYLLTSHASKHSLGLSGCPSSYRRKRYPCQHHHPVGAFRRRHHDFSPTFKPFCSVSFNHNPNPNPNVGDRPLYGNQAKLPSLRAVPLNPPPLCFSPPPHVPPAPAPIDLVIRPEPLWLPVPGFPCILALAPS